MMRRAIVLAIIGALFFAAAQVVGPPWEGSQVVGQRFALQWDGPEERVLFRLYDGDQIVLEKIEGTTVSLVDVAIGLHSYTVTAFNRAGESERSNVLRLDVMVTPSPVRNLRIVP